MKSSPHCYLFLLILIAACTAKAPVSEHPNTDNGTTQTLSLLSEYESVNPFIGTGGHGHTYPGATSPFGMVQLSPDTRLEGWDGCSGYHYSDSIIYGFSHTHLQGTGVADYCDILFMPTNHRIKSADQWNDAYKSKFSHKSEVAQPGYYKVKLDDYNINAEFTTTPRTGIHHYEFAPGDSCRLFIDMMHRDELLQYDIQTIGDTIVYGYRISKGWAEEQHCYFYAVFSEPFHDFTQLDISYNETDENGTKRSVIEQVQVFSLQFSPIRELTVKVGISGVDCDGARKNLEQEAPHWDFGRYKAEARKSWEKKLSGKVPSSISNQDDLTNYTTALYHCYTVPNLWSDIDSRYRGEDKKIHTAVGYNRYTVFSLWDTFRAYHPLMSYLEPEITRDWIVTFLEIYKERGELPVWELAGNETYCMIGYHSVPVILDAYRRGITDFDHQLALEAMVASATGPQEEKKAYEELGYVPADKFSESVSKTLEFAYDDWCIAQFAKELGDEKNYARFIRRSQNWKNVFDSETGFMRPRRNGGFPSPFDPYQVDFNFTEANSWQYSLFVPHDIETLKMYHGGETPFAEKLNSLFTVSSKTTGREQSDITGLIGQYAHGNEPSHHAAFLFNYLESPDKREKALQIIHKIMSELYKNAPDGLCGNEDCGQMSAWYVLAANHVYSLCPGKKELLEIPDSRHISTTSSNRLDFIPATPHQESMVKDYLQLPAPVILGPQTAFSGKAEVTVYCADRAAEITCEIRKRVTDTETGEAAEIVTQSSFMNRHTFEVATDQSFDVYCVAKKPGHEDSKKVHAIFRHSNMNMQMVYSTTYDNQYTGGGQNALIDGIRGGSDFRTGAWQGWRGKDVELIVDLGKERPISTVGISCLEEIKSWIWYPSSIDVFISHDGVNYGNAGDIKSSEPLNDYKPKTKEFTKQIRASGRYVKFVIHPGVQPIPQWHEGAGETCWIFADEIIIR